MNAALFSRLPCSLPSSHLCLHLLRRTPLSTEDEAALHTCLWESSEEERERWRVRDVGGASRCQQWYQAYGRWKLLGCNYTGFPLQTGGWRLLQRMRWSTCQTKQWLSPDIALQSMAKQMAWAVQHSAGKEGRCYYERSPSCPFQSKTPLIARRVQSFLSEGKALSVTSHIKHKACSRAEQTAHAPLWPWVAETQSCDLPTAVISAQRGLKYWKAADEAEVEAASIAALVNPNKIAPLGDPALLQMKRPR